MVKANETDILVIILGNIHKFKDREYEIWLSNFNPKNKAINIVNYCSKLANYLGENICLSLPGFHAFTGGDYTAAFFRKTQKKLNILKKNHQYQLH